MRRRRTATKAKRPNRRLITQSLEQRYLLAGDTIGDAMPVAIGSVTSEQISPLDEVDMYSITLAAADAVLIDIDVPSGDPELELDSFLRIFDGLGNELDFSDDDTGPGPEGSYYESFLAFEAPIADTYYIGVSSYSNETYDPITGGGRTPGSVGDYELIVDFGVVNTFTVDTTLDDASPFTTSLRDAIEQVNAASPNSFKIIDFDFAATPDPPGGVYVLQPATALPDIQQPVNIVGLGFLDEIPMEIQIDGSLLSGSVDGFRISADYVRIASLEITNFPGDGIEAIGVTAPSIDFVTLSGHGRNGLRLNGTQDAVVQDSEIYGNGAAGIQITGASLGNVIQFNQIGGYVGLTDFVPDGNATYGIQVLAPGNVINGNTIAGNGSNGISISNPAAGDNLITANNIGNAPFSNEAFPNGAYGVLIKSANNIVGSLPFGDEILFQQNVISGNARSGLVISGAAATGNQVVGNLIGTDSNGDLAIPNGAYGVLVTGATGNTIGGEFGEGNVVSGNSGAGIALSGGSSSNTVQGNLVGLKSNGFEPLGNGSIGVYLRAGANNNDIVENFIAGNPGAQLSMVAASTTSNSVRGNLIGFGDDFAPINGGSVAVLVKSPSNTIGGPNEVDANYITGSTTGISLSGTSANNTLIQGNVIGADGAIPGNNHGMVNGVQIVQGAHDNTLDGNTIAYNTSDGVRVTNTGGINNRITQNSMYGNGFGIDLGPNGFTANDPADADQGPNRLQNSGVSLTADGQFISANVVEITLNYFVDSDPANAAYPLTVEFFVSDSIGQGLQHVSTNTFTETDFVNGFATHTDQIDITTLLFAADFGTATVTDANGNTSEFTPAVPIDIDVPAGFAAPSAPAAALDPMDVNGDRTVTARDALFVINMLAAQQADAEQSDGKSAQGDVNGDGITSARDALAIINRLGRYQAEVIDHLFSSDHEVDGLLVDELELLLF